MFIYPKKAEVGQSNTAFLRASPFWLPKPGSETGKVPGLTRSSLFPFLFAQIFTIKVEPCPVGWAFTPAPSPPPFKTGRAESHP